MRATAPATAIELLGYLHAKLDEHFRQLQVRRAQLDPVSPVFALEHDLDEAQLALLKSAVQSAIQQGFGPRFRRFWLPFVVYAAEVGYDYVGDEYWPSLEAAGAARGWATQNNRQFIKAFFRRFAGEYGGARPTGAWAEHFRIICWPITHAVLPTYLQRYLAQLMYEYRTGLTTAVLNDPAALGARLASRAVRYTERFRIFCENTSLLGQVAAALLAGDDEASPYLTAPTLHRIVEGLSKESQSRTWLRETKRYAHQLRSSVPRSHRVGTTPAPKTMTRLPCATDPRFLLRREPTAWVPFVAFPDLSPLSLRLPHIAEELRSRQALIAGVARRIVPGRLLDPGQEVVLTSWPRADQPFVQLLRGPDDVNRVLASQCVITPGPWWLFRVRPGAPAVQVKAPVVRPGYSYCLVGRTDDAEPPDVTWATEVPIAVEGAHGVELTVPPTVGESDRAALAAIGIAVATDVRVRPVGVVAASWDGEGAVEWLASELAMIGIRSGRTPSRLVVTVDNVPHLFTWPDHDSETFIQLDGLEIGSHEIVVSLLPAAGETAIATAALQAVVHDPQIRPENATCGEGIRILTSPSRPSLNELWDNRAELEIEGPAEAPVHLSLTLRDLHRNSLATLRRTVHLPISTAAWREFARQELRRNDLGGSYDDAESCEITVSRSGLGYASLHVERGFQPLRWIISRRDRQPTARLVDRTDGGETRVEFFAVEAPTTAIPKPPELIIELLPQGGLVRAIAGQTVAAVILPPDRNDLMARHVRPEVPVGQRTTAEVVRLLRHHAQWSDAALPADAFAQHQRDLVLEAITREVVCLVAGSHKWSRLERRLDHEPLLNQLQEMQDLVSNRRRQRAIAKAIGNNLWRWGEAPGEMSAGLAEAIRPVVARLGLADRPDFVSFLLHLVRTPGRLATWPERDRDVLIEKILRSPVLIRAARFAVLGARALTTDDEAHRASGGSG
ncbi:MAG: hypothetical protein ACRDRN_03215 [Sciscionella sp.]